MEEEKENINYHETEIMKLKNEKENIKRCIDQNKKIEETVRINKELIDIIKNGYVDDLLTNKILPKIENHVNEILTSFVKYRIKIETEGKFIRVYKVDEEKNRSNALKLSGYEILMCNVAFRMAMNNINKLYSTNFFIIDEAFSYCDEISMSKIAKLFEYMREMYDFVLVISHNEQIKAYTDYDLRVEEAEGYSYVNMITKENERKYESLLG